MSEYDGQRIGANCQRGKRGNKPLRYNHKRHLTFWRKEQLGGFSLFHFNAAGVPSQPDMQLKVAWTLTVIKSTIICVFFNFSLVLVDLCISWSALSAVHCVSMSQAGPHLSSSHADPISECQKAQLWHRAEAMLYTSLRLSWPLITRQFLIETNK